MRKHPRSKFLPLMLLLASSSSIWSQQGIVPVRQPDGHLVFENAPEARKQSRNVPAAQKPNDPGLFYWSTQTHRWKAVPPATPASMRAAHSAADEVRRILARKQREMVSANRANYVGTANHPQFGMNKAVAPEWASRATYRGRYASISHGGNLPAPAFGSPDVESAIEDAALRNNVDANLVRAIIQVESNFNPHAVSQKGAVGLMQLMPTTARSLNVKNAFDPQENVDAGVRHFKKLMDNYGGNIELSLAAYNAGSSAVQHHKGVPPYAETQNYVKRITGLYAKQGSKPLMGRPGHPIHTQHDSSGHVLFTDLD